MCVIKEIFYMATENETKVSQKGSFRLKGKNRVQTALDWWRKIKKEMQVDIELEKVTADGTDITEQVIKLQRSLG